MTDITWDGDDVVFSQPHGGLGDNLLYSTLPERFARIGKRFYIARSNAVRGAVTHDLVWGLNPYVAGVSDAPPNAGECRYGAFVSRPKSMNTISHIEAAHGFQPEGGIPQVHYKPNRIDELADRIVVDMGANTLDLTPDQITEYLSMVFVWFQYPREKAVQVLLEPGAAVPTRPAIRVNGFASLQLKSLYHYCDVLASCAGVVALSSGALTLAVALRQNRPTPFLIGLTSRTFFNSRLAIFPGVEYFIA